MPYRLRVFARDPNPLSVQELRSRLVGKFELVSEDKPGSSEWTELILRHRDGEDIALIERDIVGEGTLGHAEIQEYLEEIESAKPRSSVEWLEKELRKVVVIYAFQLLNGTDVRDGWDGLYQILEFILDSRRGFSHADLEGFSNDDGYQILWQFSDHVSGPWNMALLQNDKWVNFEMELGNAEQRAEFQEVGSPKARSF
jgi:hypothetical protein